MLKVNNNSSDFLTCFTPFSSASTIDFKQVNVFWEY